MAGAYSVLQGNFAHTDPGTMFYTRRLNMDLQLKFDDSTVQHEVIPGSARCPTYHQRPEKKAAPAIEFAMTQVAGAFKISPTPRLFLRSARLQSKTAANPPQFHSLGPWQTPKIQNKEAFLFTSNVQAYFGHGVKIISLGCFRVLVALEHKCTSAAYLLRYSLRCC